MPTVQHVIDMLKIQKAVGRCLRDCDCCPPVSPAPRPPSEPLESFRTEHDRDRARRVP